MEVVGGRGVHLFTLIGIVPRCKQTRNRGDFSSPLNKRYAEFCSRFHAYIVMLVSVFILLVFIPFMFNNLPLGVVRLLFASTVRSSDPLSFAILCLRRPDVILGG